MAFLKNLDRRHFFIIIQNFSNLNRFNISAINIFAWKEWFDCFLKQVIISQKIQNFFPSKGWYTYDVH